MKKSLIAGAILAAGFATVAQAQNVQVYGQVHQYIESRQTGTADSINGIANEGSRIGFRGTEDLGGGLKASFVIETGFNADSPSATNVGSRRSLIALGNQWINVGLGRDKTILTKQSEKYLPFMHPYAVISTHEIFDLRFNNAVWVEANPIKGLTVNYEHSFSERAGVSARKAMAVDYDAGPFAVAVARFDDGINNESTLISGAVRPIKGLELTTQFSDETVVGRDSKGRSVAASYDVLPERLKVMASVGRKTGAVVGDQVGIGASYALSKRTWLHARYNKEDFTTDSRDRKIFGVGVQHTF